MLSQSARRPFALFTQKWYNADGSKDSHAAEMKRLGQAWRALSDGEKMVYRQQCVQEFQEQNRQLANIGVQRRGVAAEQPNADSAEAAGSQTGKKPQCHGHYQTEGLLGSGSYGKVYYAVSPSTGQPVALKVFPHDSLDMTWELHMCQALCQKVGERTLRHFSAVVQADDRAKPAWIAYEYKGASLSQCQPFGSQEMWMATAQAQSALRAMHGQARLVHLDIKPDNVLWSASTRQITICDLGMAESMDTDPREPTRFPAYTSPYYRPNELWYVSRRHLRSLLQPAVDIFSFGALVFYMLTQAHLFAPFRSQAEESESVVVQAWARQHGKLLSLLCGTGKSQPGHAERETVLLCRRVSAVEATLWRQTVLKACDPEPAKRQWPSMQSLRPAL